LRELESKEVAKCNRYFRRRIWE